MSFEFAEEINEELESVETENKWKVLIVDDEEVHNITKSVLKKFEFEGKKRNLTELLN